MKENKLIKYDGGQLEKVKNVIAITNKLLKPVSKEEQDLILQNPLEQNKMLTAMLIIKKQIMQARKHKAINEYLDNMEREQ